MISITEIIGPVMKGPSSSHTLGAYRISKIARKIYSEIYKRCTVYLYESFWETAIGHGTIVALAAGLLDRGLKEWNIESIKEKIFLSQLKRKGITFKRGEEDKEHPNTVGFLFDEKYYIEGSSLGGGVIEIKEINGFLVHHRFELPTFIVFHKDEPGILAFLTSRLSSLNINIATINTVRKGKGLEALTLIEIDRYPKEKNNELKNSFIPSSDTFFKMTFIESIDL